MPKSELIENIDFLKNKVEPIQDKGFPFGKLFFYGIIAIIFFVFILPIILNFFAIVPAGNVGIQDTFGQVSDTILPSGFVFKFPFTSIIALSTQTLKYSATATAASSDLQDVKTEITVNYRINPQSAKDIYKNIGVNYEDKIIIPAVQEAVKAATAQFTAADLITQRPRVKALIEETLGKRLLAYNLIVETVSITDFKFSEIFSSSIETKVTAEQQALKAKNDLERIKIEKEQTITQAEAAAQSTKLNADAQAYALQVINEQLEKNKTLIEYKAIEKWNGILPIYSGQAVPFINLNQTNQQEN